VPRCVWQFCLHAVVLAGFLARWRLGLPVELHPDAHPSETLTPIVASIISFGTENPKAKASLAAPLDAGDFASVPTHADIPTSVPSWSAEEEPAPATAQPIPSAGRTGLYCEIHIHQSPAGRVEAVDFGECTGDFVWQHTLLQTVERAAQLIDPTPDARFPPVRTLTVGTDNLSAVLLAQQLSSATLFEKQTTSGRGRP
jgi:hypothetical protein